jgi:hypothetical protein
MRYMTCGLTLLAWLWLMPATAAASDADREALSTLLHDFLARATEQAAHERFWADDLVYTSSSGLRFGKADILAGFEQDDEAAEEPPVAYSGDNVDIRLYGDTAVVAFRLVGTPADGSGSSYYYNTGTFLKREGEWRVIAWQATRIPAE